MAYDAYNNDKYREVAYNYVFRTPGNKTASLRLWKSEHPEEGRVDELANPSAEACTMFKKAFTQKCIAEFQEELRTSYENMRDRCVAALADIAFSDEGTRSERTAAIKELNNMFGYNAQNININGAMKQEIEIVVE